MSTTAYSIVVLVMLLSGAPIMAQDDDAAPADDTALYSPDQALDGYMAVSNPINTETRLRQNPTSAMFKSMVLPGWGQLGNKRYTKAGIYVGLEAFWVYLALDYSSQASDFYDKYQSADSLSTKNEMFGQYEDKKNKRNRYTWFAVLTVFISMFDAYVDAHLSGFPVVDQLEPLELSVGPSRHYDFGASFTYRF